MTEIGPQPAQITRKVLVDLHKQYEEIIRNAAGVPFMNNKKLD